MKDGVYDGRVSFWDGAPSGEPHSTYRFDRFIVRKHGKEIAFGFTHSDGKETWRYLATYKKNSEGDYVGEYKKLRGGLKSGGETGCKIAKSDDRYFVYGWWVEGYHMWFFQAGLEEPDE